MKMDIVNPVIDLSRLQEPFQSLDIEWRVQSAGAKNGKPWARVLAYVTNRAIMDRLDDVCGAQNWSNSFYPGPQGGVMCAIEILCSSKWVSKSDGADTTAIESIKGGYSASMKRAAVQWGIGRYLYKLSADYAVVTGNGSFYQKAKQGAYSAFNWNPPALPAWALPKNHPPVQNYSQPEDEPEDTQTIELNYYNAFQECETIQALKVKLTELWHSNPDDRTAITAAKDLRKQELSI